MNESILETLAWVNLRFYWRPDSDDLNPVRDAKSILGSLLTPGVYSEEDRLQYLSKYRQLFGIEYGEDATPTSLAAT